MTIANNDFNILADKLSIILRYAKEHIPPSDLKAVNALRVISAIHRKINKQAKSKKGKLSNDCQ